MNSTIYDDDTAAAAAAAAENCSIPVCFAWKDVAPKYVALRELIMILKWIAAVLIELRLEI